MADPARIKVENESEMPTAANEEKNAVKKEPDDAALTTSKDENKEPSSQELPKQLQKSVSVYISFTLNMFVFVYSNLLSFSW